VITGCNVQDKGFGKYLQRPLKKGSGYVVQKHVAFAPARQKQLGSRLRSPLPPEI